MINEYKIDQYFELPFSTSRFDTGAGADADSLPTFRVYEENNETAVATGNCAKRDDGNTLGLYYARAQATTAAGFEVGKTYAVTVNATVNSVVSGDVHIGSFKIIPTVVWDSLHGGTDSLEVDTVAISGDTTAADNCELMFDGTGYAGGTTKLSVAVSDKTGFSLSATGIQAIWEYSARTLTSFGTLIADIWASATRSLTDKAGFTLHSDYDAAKTAAPTTAQIKTAIEVPGSTLAQILEDTGTTLDDKIDAIDLSGVAGAVLDAVAADHNTAGTVGQKINSAGSAADPLLTDPSTYVEGTIGYIINLFGTGNTLKAFTSQLSGVPLAGVRVMCFADAAHTVQVGGMQVSDADGKTYWMVNSGSTYYFWQQKAGVSFTNPDIEVAP